MPRVEGSAFDQLGLQARGEYLVLGREIESINKRSGKFENKICPSALEEIGTILFFLCLIIWHVI